MKRQIVEKWTILRDAIFLWSEKNAFQLAGALAFYTLFSLAPLLIVLITMTGVFFGEEAVRGEISAQLQEMIGDQPAEAVEEAIRRSRIEEAGILPTLLGFGFLLFGATTVFAQMQAGLNHMWDVASKPSRSGVILFLRTRLVSLGLVLIIGFLLLVSFVLTVAATALVRYAEHWIPIPSQVVTAVDVGLSLLVVTALFAMIYKVLPDVNLEWRNVWRGAFITTLLFVLGQYLISLYLTHQAPGSAYGAAGSLVLVLMWVYYSALILFFGAALTRVYLQHQGGSIEPSKTAVKVRREYYEDKEAEEREEAEHREEEARAREEEEPEPAPSSPPGGGEGRPRWRTRRRRDRRSR